jgi:hypothetical protein
LPVHAPLSLSHLLFFVFVETTEMAVDKQADAKEREKIDAVRKLLRKQAPLSIKQVMRAQESALLCARAHTHIHSHLCPCSFFSELVSLLIGHGGGQAQYCDDACVERFLRWRGESVKKAAKHLRTVLSWRETVGAGTYASFHPSRSTFAESYCLGPSLVSTSTPF